MYRQNPQNPSAGKFQTYNSLKNQLELQTQNLLRQRNFINHRYTADPFPSQNTIIQQSGLQDQQNPGSYLHTSPPYQDSQILKKKLIKTKIEQIIKICNSDKQTSSNEFGEVIEAEKQILNFLSQPNNQQYDNSKTRHQGSVQQQSNPHTFQAKSQKSSIRERYNYALGDDAMEMIQEIQRKALIQIENLRKDKISIMRKLNQQIKDHNQQKKRSLVLQSQNKYLRQQLAKYRNIYEKKNNRQQSVQQPVNQNNQSQHQYHHQNYSQQQNQQQPQYQQANLHIKNNFSNQTNEPELHRYPSEYYQNPGQINQQNQLQTEVIRLQEQNAHFREMLQSGSQGNNQKLRAYLINLQNKIRNYESVIRSQDPNSQGQFRNILNQGKLIQEQGKKLLKVSSKPEIRYRVNSNQEDQKAKYFQQINNLKSKIRQMEIENDNFLKRNSYKQLQSPQTYGYSSRQTRSPTYNYAHKPTTSHYENIINQMRKVTKS